MKAACPLRGRGGKEISEVVTREVSEMAMRLNSGGWKEVVKGVSGSGEIFKRGGEGRFRSGGDIR